MMAALNKAYISQIPRNMPDPGGGVPGEGESNPVIPAGNTKSPIRPIESGRWKAAAVSRAALQTTKSQRTRVWRGVVWSAGDCRVCRGVLRA